jgi:hypothetical protein
LAAASSVDPAAHNVDTFVFARLFVSAICLLQPKAFCPTTPASRLAVARVGQTRSSLFVCHVENLFKKEGKERKNPNPFACALPDLIFSFSSRPCYRSHLSLHPLGQS